MCLYACNRFEKHRYDDACQVYGRYYHQVLQVAIILLEFGGFGLVGVRSWPAAEYTASDLFA